jgi:hypothetical protein
MPAGDSLGLDDGENLRPAGPDMAKGRPEEPVKGIRCWAWPLPLEDDDQNCMDEFGYEGFLPLLFLYGTF